MINDFLYLINIYGITVDEDILYTEYCILNQCAVYSKMYEDATTEVKLDGEGE